MKTPMQELIEGVNKWMLDDEEVLNNPLDYEEYMVMHANQMIKVKGEFIDMCKSLLEKEKEVMCEFAKQWFVCFGYKSVEEYYNKTFNTEEK